MSLDLDPNLIAIGITTFLVSIIPVIWTSWIDRSSYKKINVTQDVFEFKVSKIWTVFIFFGGGGIGFTFFYIPYSAHHQELLSYLIFGGIGIVFLSFYFWFLYLSLASKIIVDRDKIIYKKGRKFTIIELSKMRDVDTVNYDIWIVTEGKKPALKIPLYFKGSSQILAILRTRQLKGGRRKM